jgi:hypothetical protein
MHSSKSASSPAGMQVLLDAAFLETTEGTSLAARIAEQNAASKPFQLHIDSCSAAPVSGLCLWLYPNERYRAFQHVLVICRADRFLSALFDQTPPTHAAAAAATAATAAAAAGLGRDLDIDTSAPPQYSAVCALISGWRRGLARRHAQWPYALGAQEGDTDRTDANIKITIVLRDMDKELLSYQRKRSAQAREEVILQLCYAMLCYAMLCYAMLYYAVLCCAVLCCAMLCYAMLCYTMLCYAVLCCAMLCYAILYYTMLCCAMLYYAMLCYAVLCYDMLCYATLCYTIIYLLCYTMLCCAVL